MNFAATVREVMMRLLDLLERDQTPYVLMGGMVVSIWGIPRATFDIDLTLSLDESGLRNFLDRAQADGFKVDAAFQGGFRDVVSGMEKVQMEWWTPEARRVEVDLFLVTTAYQRESYSRRRRVRVEDREAWVLSPADLILHKLVAGRPKDLADVQNILCVQGLTDSAYTRAWATRLGVDEALAKALASANLPPTDVQP